MHSNDTDNKSLYENVLSHSIGSGLPDDVIDSLKRWSHLLDNQTYQRICSAVSEYVTEIKRPPMPKA